jgi:hypothetical protein
VLLGSDLREDVTIGAGPETKEGVTVGAFVESLHRDLKAALAVKE